MVAMLLLFEFIDTSSPAEHVFRRHATLWMNKRIAYNETKLRERFHLSKSTVLSLLSQVDSIHATHFTIQEQVPLPDSAYCSCSCCPVTLHRKA